MAHPKIVYQLVATAWRSGEPHIMTSPVVYSTKEKALAATYAFAKSVSLGADDAVTHDDVHLRYLELK